MPLTGGGRASDGGAGGRLDGLQVLAAGLRGLLEDLVELLLALADKLGEVIAELVGVPRHPVRAARLDLLVHAVQGGLQFALERTAELLDQTLQDSDAPLVEPASNTESEPNDNPDAPTTFETVDHPTDAQLVARCRAGDQTAWRELVERFSRYVYAISVQGFRLPEHDADDVFQEVFTRAYTHLDRLRDDTALRPWIAQLTRNLCLDRLRDSSRTQPVSDEELAKLR